MAGTQFASSVASGASMHKTGLTWVADNTIAAAS
jgi:hypothetical protein